MYIQNNITPSFIAKNCLLRSQPGIKPVKGPVGLSHHQENYNLDIANSFPVTCQFLNVYVWKRKSLNPFNVTLTVKI